MNNWKDLFPKDNRYFETDKDILYKGDALEILKNFSESIDLIVTSPPYFNIREYIYYESYDKYLKIMEKIFFII